MAEGVPPIVTELVLDSRPFDQGIGNATRKLNGFRDILDQYGSELDRLSNQAIAIGAALGAGLAPGIVNAQRLEQALARTFSVGELTTAEMNRLRNATLRLGQGVTGPVQLARALYGLASAGLSVNEQLEVLPEVERLAVSQGYELEEMTGVLVQTMRAFNLEATETNRIVNVIAASNATSSGNAQRLGDAFRYAGATAAGMGLELEETTTALNILIGVFQRGEQAGTSLRSLLGQLANPLPRVRDAIEEVELSVRDLQPQFTNLEDLSRNLGLVIEEAGGAAVLFGQESANAAQILADNADRFVEMEEAITGTNAAAEQYDKQMSTTINRLTKLRNTIVSTSASYGQYLKPAIDLAVGAAQVFVEVLNAIPGPIKALITVLAAFQASWFLIGGIVSKVTNSLVQSAVASRAYYKVAAWGNQIHGKTGQLFQMLGDRLYAYRMALKAQGEAHAAYRAASEAAYRATAAASQSAAAVQARASAAAAAARLREARAHVAAKAAILSSYVQTKLAAIRLATVMTALREVVIVTNIAMTRLMRTLWAFARHPVVLTVVAIGLAMRQLMKQVEILDPAMAALSNSLTRMTGALEPLQQLWDFLGDTVNVVAIGVMGAAADTVNALAYAMERGAISAEKWYMRLNPALWGQIPERFEELNEQVEELNARFLDTSGAIDEEIQQGLADVFEWDLEGDPMNRLRQSLEMTEEQFAKALGAAVEFRQSAEESAEGIIFDVDASQMERQLASVDERVRTKLEDLREEADENPIVYSVNADLEPLEEGEESLFESRIRAVEEAGEEAARIITDNFVNDIQREADQAYVDSLDEGAEKITAEFELREQEIEERRREEIEGAEGHGRVIAAIERRAHAERLANRREYNERMAQLDEDIARTLRRSERLITDARIEAMDEGAAKIRAKHAQRVADVQREADERIEAVRGNVEAERQLREDEAAYLALLAEQRDRELAEHNESVREALEESTDQFQRATDRIQRSIDQLTAEQGGSPFAEMLVRQRQEMTEARQGIREVLDAIQDDFEEGVITLDEATRRSNEILARWGEQEVLLLNEQADEFREELGRREAEIIRHNAEIAELRAEAAQVGIPDEEATGDRVRDRELRALNAWYDEKRALAVGNAEELTRIEEKYWAEREVIQANARQREADAQQQALRERAEAEVALSEGLAREGIAGEVRADDLRASADALRAVREELRAAGAEAEAIQLLTDAIGETNEAISDLRRQGSDLATTAIADVRRRVSDLQQELYGTEETRANEALERRLDSLSEERDALQQQLSAKLGDTEAYYQALAKLDEEFGNLRVLIEERTQTELNEAREERQAEGQEIFERAIRQLRESSDELRSSLDDSAVESSRNALERRIEHLDLELQATLERLREKFGYTRAYIEAEEALREEHAQHIMLLEEQQRRDEERIRAEERVNAIRHREKMIELEREAAEARQPGLEGTPGRQLQEDLRQLEAWHESELAMAQDNAQRLLEIEQEYQRRRDVVLADAEKRERERAEEVAATRRKIDEEAAKLRADAIRDDVRRAEALFRIERGSVRRAFLEQLDELDATLQERLELLRGHQEREQLAVEQHARNIADIVRGQTVEAFASVGAIQQETESARRQQRQDAARDYILSVEDEIEAREEELDASEKTVEGIEEEIDALERRNAQLRDTISQVTSVRNYYRTLQNLLQPLRTDDPEVRARILRRRASSDLRDMERLFEAAVRNNAPLETRKAILQDLVELDKEVRRRGGTGVSIGGGVVGLARQEYQRQIQEAQRAAEEYETNQQALAKLGSELDGFKDTVEGLNTTLEKLNTTLDRLNAEAEGQIWSETEERFLSLAETGDVLRERWIESFSGLIEEVADNFSTDRADYLADKVLELFEKGNIRPALRRWAQMTGEEMTVGMFLGLLETPAPSDASQTLAESLGIDDPQAFADELTEGIGYGLTYGIEQGADDAGEDGGAALRGMVEDMGPDVEGRARDVGQTAGTGLMTAFARGVDANAEGLTRAVEEASESGAETLQQAIRAMGDDVEAEARQLGLTAGEGLISAFAEGVEDNMQVLVDAVDRLLQEVRDSLPSSDAKRGPLSDLTISGQRFVRTWLGGAEQEGGRLTAGMDRLLSGLTPTPSASRTHPAGSGPGGGPVVVNFGAREQAAPGPVAQSGREFARTLERELQMRGVIGAV